MYNWNDILIVGDSFCSDRNKKYHWPQILVSNLTGETFNSKRQPRGKGMPGGSWWSYRKIILKELEISIPKILIVCHTEPYRIPNDNDVGLNFRSVETRLINVNDKEYKMPDEVHQAAFQYYKHLMSFDFYNWAVHQWFKELDDIVKKYSIEKIVHFFGFDGDYSNYTFDKGVTIGIPLYTYAEEQEKYFLNFKKPSGNHYTLKGNELFANTLTDIITDYPGDKTRLNIKMVQYGYNRNKE